MSRERIRRREETINNDDAPPLDCSSVHLLAITGACTILDGRDGNTMTYLPPQLRDSQEVTSFALMIGFNNGKKIRKITTIKTLYTSSIGWVQRHCSCQNAYYVR